jgi:hypothetical protein
MKMAKLMESGIVTHGSIAPNQQELSCDNIRNPIFRFYFNEKQKNIGIFAENNPH